MRPSRGFGKSLVSNSEGVGLMIETELWLTPLILLPGVALLIMSTSARFGQIHAEFHHLLDHADAHAEILSRHLVLRSALYRNALISLHASVGLFALGSLLGGLLNLRYPELLWMVGGLTLLGIGGIVFASACLVRESMICLRVISEHSQRVAEGQTRRRPGAGPDDEDA
jgi:hypothetical protein